MINEEVSHKLINIEMRIAAKSLNEIIKNLKILTQKAKEQKMKLSNYIDSEFKSKVKPLKEMVQKGQLEQISINKGELKELKKLLNRYGVNFSIMKDKISNEYSVFFQSKDTKAMEKAFMEAVKNAEKKYDRKESTIKKVKEFKEKSNTIFCFSLLYSFTQTIATNVGVNETEHKKESTLETIAKFKDKISNEHKSEEKKDKGVEL